MCPDKLGASESGTARHFERLLYRQRIVLFCFLFKVLSDQFLAASGGDRVRFSLVHEMVLDVRIAVSDEVAPDKDAAWIQSIVDSRYQYRFPV